jgi:competence protein ComEA
LRSGPSMMPLVWEMKRPKRSDQHTGLSVLILLLIAGWAIQYLVSVQGTQGSAGKNNDIFVGVEGPVNKPGVYCFERKPSLRDLIRRAGGLQDGSDDDYGSYPAFVQGTMVHISTEHGRVEVSTEALPAAYKITLLIPISMNEASQEELVAIPEIGPELAQRIIDHRSRYGPFTTIDELTTIPGIGKVRLSRIRPFVEI